MDRGIILENIAKLNTFVMLSKTNEFLCEYVKKILNNKCKKVKFSSDFDCNSMDLLYSSLQLMTNSGALSSGDYSKIDKKELKFYIDKVQGINYFSKQVRNIKNEEMLVNYIKTALETGAYVCNYNDTVKFDNGLIVDAKWLIDFVGFLVESLRLNRYLSNDSKTFSHRVVMIDNNYDNFEKYLKGIKIYDYSVNKKGRGILSFQNVKYLIDVLSDVQEYDFEVLKGINSSLTKDGYTLSINKSYPKFSKEQKKSLKSLFEDENYELIEQYVRDNLNSCDSKSNYNRNHSVDIYENLKILSHAYFNKIELNEIRDKIKLFSKNELVCAITMGDFYINYVYDEKQLDNYFEYDLLRLDMIKPSIIDYETDDYKRIIKNLSLLNKRMVTENRKINRYLGKNRNEYKNNLENSCVELDKIIKDIKSLRESLELEKNNNLSNYNINKIKIKAIKEAIITGSYCYQNDVIVFSVLKRNYYNKFCLEIDFNDFIEYALSDYNKNLRISFYQM